MSRIFRAALVPLAIAALSAPTLASAQTAGGSAPSPATPQPVDHAQSYYHYGLAKLYEEQAVASGRQDVATQAIEQYKMALDADPNSRVLQDGVEAIANAGATAIIQPGGSVRDAEVIAAADRLGVAMVFTGIRHFRHG